MKYYDILNLLQEDKSVNILHTTPEDMGECIKVCKKTFKPKYADAIDGETERVDWNLSYKAEISGYIVGCYLLTDKSSVTDVSYCEIEDLSKYENKKGIEGIVLAVLPEYQKLSIGRKLRDAPLHLGYDYIWGMQFYTLDNIKNWTDFGRRIVADDKRNKIYISLMDLK